MGDCLAIGIENGFRLYQISPTFSLIKKVDIDGGVKLVQHIGTLGSNHYLALVGSGKNEIYPSHKIVLWNVHNGKGVSEINFKSPVLALSCANDQM